MTGLGNLKEDIKQNPTKFAMMGSTAPLRGGALDDAYMASRRMELNPMQLYERTATNYPKPSAWINAQIENIKSGISLNRELGNMEEVSKLARQWAQLVRQRATL